METHLRVFGNQSPLLGNILTNTETTELSDVLEALLYSGTEHETDVVYQWKTARGAVAMEFITEAAAREWHDKRMKKPMADCMPALELFKVETTTVSTKL